MQTNKEKPAILSILQGMKWVPSLYLAEGIPYVIVLTVSVAMYKRLGMSNEDIALYTSWLYLPWVIKPFWSPVVDMLGTKRLWILAMQCLIGASLAGVAFTINSPNGVQWSLAFLWLMAFSSATHDIAADGMYILALSPREQAFFVGIRSTFYRIATIAGSGLLIMLAGYLEAYLRVPAKAWALSFGTAGAFFLALCLLHAFTLPRAASDIKKRSAVERMRGFIMTIPKFFTKPHIIVALLFMLFYRLPEALLTKICPLFLLDSPTEGGLGLTTAQLGLAQGTVGVIGLVFGGILGGIMASRFGWKKCIWPMVLSISLPNIVYVILAYYQPDSLVFTSSCIFIEQFGYGYGFTAYMLYLLYFSQGDSATSHYAFCTGFMALSMMLPGMVAGWLQETVIGSYLNFFIFVMALVPITFLVAAYVKVEPEFGKDSKPGKA